MKKVDLKNKIKRVCDYCGSNKYESILSYKHKARTRNNEFVFSINNVVCQKCGFAYVTPVPSQEQLDLYYADSYSKFLSQTPSSQFQTRYDVVKDFAGEDKVYLEIGINSNAQIIKKYEKIFQKCYTVELNNECDTSFSNIKDVPDAYCDVLTHYYVLEHTQDTNEFLQECHRVLKDGGIMVCEVPDMTLYYNNPQEYIWWEHITHFSQHTLIDMLNKSRFELIDVNRRNCSNTTGFLAVSRKTDTVADMRYQTENVIINTNNMKDGTQSFINFLDNMSALRDKILYKSAKGEKVALWGMNDIAFRLYNLGIPKENILLVDDDVRKKDFLPDATVECSENIVKQLGEVTMLVIFSKRFKEVIYNKFKNLTQKTLKEEQVVVLDYNGSENVALELKGMKEQNMEVAIPVHAQERLKKEGYVQLDDVLSDELVALGKEIASDFTDLILQRWSQEGLIEKENYLHLDIYKRFHQAWLDGNKPQYRRDPIKNIMNEKMYRFLSDPTLIAIVRKLLGTDEVNLHGIFNLRLKHKDMQWTITPWHKDGDQWVLHGEPKYSDLEKENVLTVWIPLNDFNAESGCMQMISKELTKDIDFTLKEEAYGFIVDDAECESFEKETIVIGERSLLTLSSDNLHRTLVNMDETISWNIDIRYERGDTKLVSGKKYGFPVSFDVDEQENIKKLWILKKQFD